MSKPTTRSIPNLIGILLIVVAIISAGGLYYTASVYTNISETYVSVEAVVSGMTIVVDNSTGDVIATVLIVVNNPSDLDIDVYRLEYMAYMSHDTSTITNYDKYVGSGSTSDRNNTVQAETIREIPVTFVIKSGSVYMERFLEATTDSNTIWTMINGLVWFNLSEYEDSPTPRVPIFNVGPVEVSYV